MAVRDAVALRLRQRCSRLERLDHGRIDRAACDRGARRLRAEWEEWINLLLGLWVLVAPWALGFAESVGAMGNHVAVGIVVAALAAIELWLVHRKPPHVHA